MHQLLETLVDEFLQASKIDHGDFAGTFVDLLNRRNREMYIGGYEDAEDYFKEVLSPELLALELDLAEQRELADRLVAWLMDHPNDSVVIYVLSKIRPAAGATPFLRFLQTHGPALDKHSMDQAIVALQNMLIPDRDPEMCASIIESLKLHDPRPFIARCIRSEDEGMPDAAMTAAQFYFAWF